MKIKKSGGIVSPPAEETHNSNETIIQHIIYYAREQAYCAIRIA